MRIKLLAVVALLAGLMSFSVRADEQTLTIVTYDSFSVSLEVLQAFEEQTGILLEIIRLNDAGAMVNQSILTRDNPLGDVLYGIDNTFLSRGLNAELFIPYESPLLEDIDDAFKVADNFAVTPVTYGDVCLNYDVAYFEANDLPLPQSLLDLIAPEYRGLLVVQSPATSSPGLAFLMATIAVFGTDESENEDGGPNDYTYLDFWADLVANDVLVVDGWSQAYYAHFTAASEDGTRPLVVSYASSPPAEVYFASEPLTVAPTGAIVADGTCFRQVEFAGILEGTDNLAGAQAFIDFLLGDTFQEDVPLQMFVYPVSATAELPEVFVKYSAVPEEPLSVDYDLIEENREAWIQAWIEVVLR